MLARRGEHHVARSDHGFAAVPAIAYLCWRGERPQARRTGPVVSTTASRSVTNVSNESLRPRGQRFARDSPLEGDGFELPVPRQGLLAAIVRASCGRNRGAARKSNYLGTPANRQYGPLTQMDSRRFDGFWPGLTLSPSVRGKSMPMSGRGPWPPRPIPDAT